MSPDVEHHALSAVIAASAACLMSAIESRIEPQCETLCEQTTDLEIDRFRELSAAWLQIAG